jgi:hypothetical protein
MKIGRMMIRTAIHQIDDGAVVASAVQGQTNFAGAAGGIAGLAIVRQRRFQIPQGAGVQFRVSEALVPGPAAAGHSVGDDDFLHAGFGNGFEFGLQAQLMLLQVG